MYYVNLTMSSSFYVDSLLWIDMVTAKSETHEAMTATQLPVANHMYNISVEVSECVYNKLTCITIAARPQLQ